MNAPGRMPSNRPDAAARCDALTREDCVALDAGDPLAAMRAAFAPAPEGWICLDANSLGACPTAAADRVQALMQQQWAGLRSQAWGLPEWLEGPQRLGAAFAPLLGARADEVVAADNTTTMLFKLLDYALRVAQARDSARRVIVYEADGFPTDCHVIQGMVRHADGRLQARTFPTSADPQAMDAALDAALGPDVAVVLLTHGDYRSGHRWAIPDVVRRVHAAGGLTLWDLSHTAGAVPIALDASRADFAVGCGYKYLCGGPGAPALAYIRKDLQDLDWPTLPGWLGHADPMAFACAYEPARGVASLIGGTMPVLQNAVMAAAAEAWSIVDPAAVFAKHRSLSSTLIRLLDERAARHGVELISPRDADRRAGHVAIRCPGGAATADALAAAGVIATLRRPDVLRLGISAPTIRHVDLWDAVSRLLDSLPH